MAAEKNQGDQMDNPGKAQGGGPDPVHPERSQDDQPAKGLKESQGGQDTALPPLPADDAYPPQDRAAPRKPTSWDRPAGGGKGRGY